MNKLEKYVTRIMRDGGSTAVGMIGNKVVEIAHRGNLEINAVDEKSRTAFINPISVKDGAIVEEFNALIPALQEICEISEDEEEIKAAKSLLELIGVEAVNEDTEDTTNEELNASKNEFDGIFEKNNANNPNIGKTEFDSCMMATEPKKLETNEKESREFDCFE